MGEGAERLYFLSYFFLVVLLTNDAPCNSKLPVLLLSSEPAGSRPGGQRRPSGRQAVRGRTDFLEGEENLHGRALACLGCRALLLD